MKKLARWLVPVPGQIFPRARLLMVILALFLVGPILASAPVTLAGSAVLTVNVTSDAPDANLSDGRCDASAGSNRCTLRAAIQEGDLVPPDQAVTIQLPSGTYTLSVTGPTDENAAAGDLDIHRNMTISGAGASTTIVQWDPNLSAANRDRLFHVFDGATVTLSGVTLKNGNAPSSGAGGAVLNGGTLTISNSTFISNTAAFGGALYNSGRSSLTLSNCTITGNAAVDSGNAAGGAVVNDADATLVISNSTIVNNTADGYAGALLNVAGGTLVLNDSDVSGNAAALLGLDHNGGGAILNQGTLTGTGDTISNNAASYGGGIYNDVGGTLALTNTIILNNHAPLIGGGIHSDVSGRVTLVESAVTGNTATQYGGGIFNPGGGQVTLIHTRVNDNRAENGGGIYNDSNARVDVTYGSIDGNVTTSFGAGILNLPSATLVLTNTTLSRNSSNHAGGGIFTGGTVTADSVTISGNIADSDGSQQSGGGGVFVNAGGAFRFQNSILAGNTDNSRSEKYPDCFGTVVSSGYNLVQDPAGCSITGSTVGVKSGLDPRLGTPQVMGPVLVIPLLASSPAIDAGNPAAPGSRSDACTLKDERGGARPLDGNGDSVSTCDMGAFEADATAPAATPTRTATPSPTATKTATPAPTQTATPKPTTTPIAPPRVNTEFRVYLPVVFDNHTP